MKTRLLLTLGTLVVGLMVPTPPAHADIYTENTLHGFCGASAAASTCSDNGTITPTSQNPLTQFGFNRSPDSNSGLISPVTFELVALLPSATPDGQTITYTGSGGGISGTVTLAQHSGTFSSGMLDAYLGLSSVGGPANPIGGFQAGQTNQALPATSFDVYTGTFGTPDFTLATDPTFTPAGAFSGVLPQGSELYALLLGPNSGTFGGGPNAVNCATTPCRQDATALSGTIIIVPRVIVPMPSTLLLIGSGLIGLGAVRRLVARRRS